MITEILRFRVPPGKAADFVARNEEIWTPTLQERPGFLRREIVRRSDDPDEIMILIRWRDRRAMEAFPKEQQRMLEKQMDHLVLEQEQQVWESVVPDEGREASDPPPDYADADPSVGGLSRP